MSKDKQKYLAAYVPESVPKETPKRSGIKSDGRTKEIEDAIAAFNELLAKQNRDNLDAMYNIDMGNMSSSMRRLFQSYDDGITKANASIESWANAQEAGFKAIAEWQDETTSSISSIEGKADANAASIKLLNQWKSESAESISGIESKADANAAQITLLNQWKGTTSSSLASVQSVASQNEAKITSLTRWQSTVEDDIEGLAETVAVIEQVADDNGASISQIVRAVGKNGEVNAASIVAAVNAAGSSVKIAADRVDITGFVTFESLENDGEAYINGNNLGLVSDSDGESISKISFYHNEQYGNSNYEIGTIYQTDDGDYGYSLCIRANRFRRSSSRYADAFLLLSGEGGVVVTSVVDDIILSSGAGISMYGQTYCDIGAARYGVRIRADSDYRDTIDSDPGENTFIFVNGGIYYIDSYGDPHEVWEL